MEETVLSDSKTQTLPSAQDSERRQSVDSDDAKSQNQPQPFPQSNFWGTSERTVSSQPSSSSLDDKVSAHTLKQESQSTTYIIKLWMSAKHRIALLRNFILTTRMDARKQKTRCKQQEESFYRIMSDFISVLGIATKSSYSQYKTDLDRLSMQLRTIWDEIKALRESSCSLEDALSNYEYQLTELEDEVYSQLDQEFRRNSPQPSPHNASNRSTQPDHATTTNADTAPRDELYSRMSDIRIFLDRLTNFEYTLGQELDERDVLRAAGQIDISSDEQFFEEAKVERARIQNDLEQAQADVAKLKEQCTRLGLEFEDVQFHNPLVDETEIYTESLSPMAEQPDIVPDERRGSSSILDSFFSARERVRNWVTNPSSLKFQPCDNGMEVREQAERGPESEFGCGWVLMPEPSRNRRPSSPLSLEAFDRCHNYPQWTTGPPPGSELLEALLLESISDNPQKTIRKQKSNTTL